MSRALLLALFVAQTASAQVHVLRMATAAPEGTAWAREIHAMSREVESLTHGTVKLKWYLGGIAGDELQMLDRIKRDQLDGIGSGGAVCTRLAPSMRVLGVMGLFQDRAEASYVAGRLKPALDGEFQKSGFVNLTELSVGPHVLFTRRPVASLTDLRKTRVWMWDLDDVGRYTLQAMGIPVVPSPIDQAGGLYDSGRSDGFLAVTMAALAFQWSTQARYLTPLRMSVLTGCLIVADRAFDPLPLESQRVLQEVAAKVSSRLESIGREQDAALLGGLFAHHGLSTVKVSDRFRAEFLEAAGTAREHMGALVPDALMSKVTTWLADYRAEHGGEKR